MKNFLLYIGILIFSYSCTPSSNFYIENGNTFIVIDQHASNAAILAAHELQHFIQKSSGIKLPIVKSVPSKQAKLFCIGKSPYTPELDTIQFKAQEYLIKITPEKIILAGQDENKKHDNGRDNNGTTLSNDRLKINYSQLINDSIGHKEITLPSIYDAQGSCYAVYDFLEKFIGIRFYGPHPLNIIIPQKAKIQFPLTEIRRTPDLKYRVGTYSFEWPMMKDQYFNSSGEMFQLFLRRIKFGGEKWAANHAFSTYQDRFLKKNPKCPELFESYHPEYFAQGRTGGAHERQFCYTNKAFIQQVAQDARDYFDGKPLKGNQIALGDYFAVVPLDNANWCQCSECKKQLEIDKNNIRGEHFNCGTASLYLWTFVNNVAKEVKKTHPDKKIAALAYHVYAYLPKDITLEDNISVAPCLHPRNYWAPKMKENEIDFYKEWIIESKKSGRPIYLWNYLCFPTERGLIQNFNVFPGFNIHEVSEQIKMYVQDGVQGIFLCGIGEQLDFYTTMKLYDDATADTDKIINEFFTSYFGNAAQPMQNFYRKIESIYSNPNNYPSNIQTKDAQFHQTEEIAWKYLGTDTVMEELGKHINDALQAASTPIEKARVESWSNGIWEYMKAGKEKYLLATEK
ncbi:DUF4838 domain-containing protein [Coprobacter secundus]|uniref:DUF4838 domain-containing protein n=1 Tax=Coprobacter secundus subsp. similis TaxID=2751153 RepID=A0A7G1HX43_9BACT|nr:DUF4838 domain-containing protein [Coprobacter secundus]BCI62984.1 hypothetical protein Cop2CBH44_13370 [Coprobacter secundus subsp. similis]